MNWVRNWVRPWRIALAGALCALLAGACVSSLKDDAAPQKADRGIKFTHPVHVQTQEMECAICHDFQSDDKIHIAIAGHSVCSACHEIPEDLTAEPAKCAYCHSREDYSLDPIVTRLTDEIKFSHGVHIDKEVACAACHRGDLDKQTLPRNLKPLCMDCHGKTEPKLNECSVCHNEMNTTVRPAFRAGARIPHDAPVVWEKVHGVESKIDPQFCALCHDAEASCDACHLEQAPADHTIAWRRKTHGIEAGWDRNKCSVCHEEDSCLKCHQNAEPQSHRGGWSSPLNRHCVSCHFPEQKNECTVCHENIEHESAMPSPHDVGIFPANCALCHPGGLPNRAPHFMNSTVRCIECHR